MKKQSLVILLVVCIATLSVAWLRLPARGLLARYYSNAEWKGSPALLRYEQNFDLEFVGDLVKYADFPRKFFSIHWNGWIRIDQDGVYRFGTKSDDGSLLTVDQQVVVDNGGIHGSREAWGEIFLPKGMHRIAVAYFNAESGYRLSVFWERSMGKPIPLSADVLFVRPLSFGAAWLSRHPFIFTRLYPALWGMLLLIIFLHPLVRDFGGTAQRRPAWNVVCNTFILLGCVVFALIVVGDNFSMLAAKQPWLIGYLRPEPNRKLSTILRVKGSGATDDAFCAALRFLYAGQTLWLPEEGLFKQTSLVDKAGMGALKFYQPQREPTSREIRRFHFKIYHRFMYNPYEFRADGEAFDKRARNEIDPAVTPKLLFLIMPEDGQHAESGDIVVVPFKRNLYFIPANQLPERIRGEIYG